MTFDPEDHDPRKEIVLGLFNRLKGPMPGGKAGVLRRTLHSAVMDICLSERDYEGAMASLTHSGTLEHQTGLATGYETVIIEGREYQPNR